MRKNIKALFIVAVMALFLTACENGNSIVEYVDMQMESTSMFDRHMLDMNYSILVDKETGVCYFEMENGYYYGITVLLNADGTPKIWKEYQQDN